MVGFGYDVHRLEEGGCLVLGGVKIECGMHAVAHSDGDVLVHALCDSLLGAAGLGDIGEHFPDTDPAYKGIDSMKLLDHVCKLLIENKFTIINIDATLVLEKPKILPFKQEMRENIAFVCGLPPQRVNIKATTNERLGFIGSGSGAAASCVCQLSYI